MEFQCSECKHNFRGSHLRLFFTRRFRGKNRPTATVAYYLTCPKCGKKSWLVPLQAENWRMLASRYKSQSEIQILNL